MPARPKASAGRVRKPSLRPGRSPVRTQAPNPISAPCPTADNQEIAAVDAFDPTPICVAAGAMRQVEGLRRPALKVAPASDLEERRPVGFGLFAEEDRARRGLPMSVSNVAGRSGPLDALLCGAGLGAKMIAAVVVIGGATASALTFAVLIVMDRPPPSKR
jgi:hypothetical protein